MYSSSTSLSSIEELRECSQEDEKATGKRDAHSLYRQPMINVADLDLVVELENELEKSSPNSSYAELQKQIRHHTTSQEDDYDLLNHQQVFSNKISPL